MSATFHWQYAVLVICDHKIMQIVTNFRTIFSSMLISCGDVRFKKDAGDSNVLNFQGNHLCILFFNSQSTGQYEATFIFVVEIGGLKWSSRQWTNECSRLLYLYRSSFAPGRCSCEFLLNLFLNPFDGTMRVRLRFSSSARVEPRQRMCVTDASSELQVSHVGNTWVSGVVSFFAYELDGK